MKTIRRILAAALAPLRAVGALLAHHGAQRVRPEKVEGRWLTSIFSMEVRDRHGNVLRPWSHQPNLRTTAGLNWQAAVMGNPTQPAPARYIAVSSDGTAPNVADTTLAGEFTGDGLARAAGTFAHTGGQSTYTISNSFVASGAGGTVQKVGLFNATGPPPAGTLVFESLEPNPPALSSGDTLAQTVTISI